MAMRPVVSYDDITTPGPPSTAQANVRPPAAQGPPPKKRKVNGGPRNSNPRGGQYPQHWDEPETSAPQMTYDDGEGEAPADTHMQDALEEGEEEEEEESRELTHEDIWDDSALVDAWDSAMAEYEAYHGKGGKWKEGPVKKSPLWYNVPPATSGKTSKGKAKAEGGISTAAPVFGNGDAHADKAVNEDSMPHNFDTFVPTHDPSLAVGNGAPGSDYATYALPESGAMVSQDEAFSRAVNAMYWSGYWTAVYHVSRGPM
ncbi:uncharacterized protein C8Q71DRAFT_57267 [Rhodofomes roseus]|uniref:Survival Motor Neuron Gemin2-binding domain-containing protein n=1 Tax=Rhodofomes roseus TaxID=34475 RepID=A0ABQ8KG40_9APHY|nr:uncharacterized protein C8Q71DRAFT_57267 [Rhodofomes roseus]KAH9836746.1 hypothetical protein C8Q71DRAFT_57267 [Rhodofomes roseus]